MPMKFEVYVNGKLVFDTKNELELKAVKRVLDALKIDCQITVIC